MCHLSGSKALSVYICRVIYYDVYIYKLRSMIRIFRKVEGLGTDLTRDFERCDVSSDIGIK